MTTLKTLEEGAVEAVPGYEMVQLGHTTSKTSPDMSWVGLNFSANNGQAKILTDCWGKVQSGQVAAIMGKKVSCCTTYSTV